MGVCLADKPKRKFPISAVSNRIDAVVERLVHKITMSQTAVPGFIVGLSGTDSIIAFEILARALKEAGSERSLYGVHYVTPGKKIGAFAEHALPWLKERHPKAIIETHTPLGGNQDPQRWADMMLRSLNFVDTQKENGAPIMIEPYVEGLEYWLAGTINATEHELGKHSIMANAVSIQPIRSLWKSDVLAACEEIGVPQIIIDNARLPDCLCGRDEIAAQHIELIDDILRHCIDVKRHDPDLLMTLMQWISDRKREGGFRKRIPYIV